MTNETENLGLPLETHGAIAPKQSLEEGFKILDEVIQEGIDTDTAVSKVYTTTLTAAQVLALFATPVQLIPAPGAGKAIIVERVTVVKPAGTAYAGIATGEDLTVKYENAAGAVLATLETTGFLDQATRQARSVRGLATEVNLTTYANKPVVAHMLTGEITTGDSPLTVKVTAAIIDV